MTDTYQRQKRATKDLKKKAVPREKPIDWDIFEQLCYIQCTQAEIASFFKTKDDTLAEKAEKHYAKPYKSIYKEFSKGGLCSLRRIQWKMAEKSAAMAIWLGKQYLDQKDQFPVVSTALNVSVIDYSKTVANQEPTKIDYEPAEVEILTNEHHATV